MTRTSDELAPIEGRPQRMSDSSEDGRRTAFAYSITADDLPILNAAREASATAPTALPAAEVSASGDLNFYAPPPVEVDTASGARHLHPGAFEAAKVRRGEGPYQSVQRLLGDSFSHKEKMSVVRALQAQYREELNSRPELAGRRADMSDLKVGHALLTKENYAAVMSKLQEANPQLHDRVAEALRKGPAEVRSDSGLQGNYDFNGGRRRREQSHRDPDKPQPQPYNDEGRGSNRQSYNNEGRRSDRRSDNNQGRRTDPSSYDQENRGWERPFPPAEQREPTEKAWSLAAWAKRVGRSLGTVGDCAKGVRLALEKVGLNFRAPNAVLFGRQLERSGHFDRHDIPLHKAQPGDIIVRNWSHAVQRANGKNSGDVVVVTGRNSDGTLRGANDHILDRIPQDGGRYMNSYVLRLKR